MEGIEFSLLASLLALVLALVCIIVPSSFKPDTLLYILLVGAILDTIKLWYNNGRKR